MSVEPLLWFRGVGCLGQLEPQRRPDPLGLPFLLLDERYDRAPAKLKKLLLFVPGLQ